MIKFNEVTKTSMIAAVVLYVATFSIAFYLGAALEKTKTDDSAGKESVSENILPTDPDNFLQEDSSKNNTEVFRGEITDYKSDCAFDGICSFTVNGDKEVVTIVGWSQDIRGTMDDVQVGDFVEVYAEKQGNGYTLYGSEDYYIKFTK